MTIQSVHSTWQDKQASLDQWSFTDEQLTRFRLYRAIYRTGYYQRDPAVERRLEFARWLYQHGKLSEEYLEEQYSKRAY